MQSTHNPAQYAHVLHVSTCRKSLSYRPSPWSHFGSRVGTCPQTQTVIVPIWKLGCLHRMHGTPVHFMHVKLALHTGVQLDTPLWIRPKNRSNCCDWNLKIGSTVDLIWVFVKEKLFFLNNLSYLPALCSWLLPLLSDPHSKQLCLSFIPAQWHCCRNVNGAAMLCSFCRGLWTGKQVHCIAEEQCNKEPACLQFFVFSMIELILLFYCSRDGSRPWNKVHCLSIAENNWGLVLTTLSGRGAWITRLSG